MTWQHDTRVIFTTIFGILLAGLGAFFLHIELKSPLIHVSLIYFFGAWVVIGCLIAVPSVMAAAIRQSIAFLGSILQAVRGS